MQDAVNLLPALDGEESGCVPAVHPAAGGGVEAPRWKPNPGQENLLMQKLSALDVPVMVVNWAGR